MQNLATIKNWDLGLRALLMINMIIYSSCFHNSPVQHYLPLRSDTLAAQFTPVLVAPTQHVIDINSSRPTPPRHILPSKKLAGYFMDMENYSIKRGFSTTIALSSCVDSKGNLWFGTSGNGVSKYNGLNFTTYTTAQGLASSVINHICEDKKGNLWFSTDGGISIFDGKTITSYTTKQGLPDNYIYCILVDTKGNNWIGTAGGVSRMDGDRKTFINYTVTDGLANNNVSSIQEDNSGNIWFGTVSGVSRLNAGTGSITRDSNGLDKTRTYSINKDKSGNLLFCTSSGVLLYDSMGKSVSNITPGQNNLSRAFEDGNGDLWFCIGTTASRMGGGICRLDKKTGIFTNYTTQEGLPSNMVNGILEDRTGNLWFTSWGGGVSRLDRNAKSSMTLTTAQGLSSNSVQAVLEDRNGDLWIATGGSGICFLDKKENVFTYYDSTQGFTNNYISSILEDKKGNIWFGSPDGVSMLYPDKKLFRGFSTSQGLISVFIARIIEDKKGNIWFGTTEGVSKLDPDRKYFTNYATAQGLINNSVNDLAEDRNGNIWFATQDGISKLSQDGKSFTNFNTRSKKNKVKSNRIICVFEDAAGNIWFGTEGGVLRYDGISFLNFSEAQGLSDNIVDDIWEDKNGIIWLGTDKGLTALKGFMQDNKRDSTNRGEMHYNSSTNYSNYELETGGFRPQFEIYNYKTGYPISGLYYNGMYISSDGIIWAGTTEKLFRLDYSKIHKNENKPYLYIQNVKINNENICWYDLSTHIEKADSISTPAILINEITLFGRELNHWERDSVREKYRNISFDSITRFNPLPTNLVLPFNHNNITFEFGAIEPARPTLMLYQFILEGYDADWGTPRLVTTASYGNIAEGTYTFKLKAKSPDGVWSEPIAYTFKVLPPWYRSWWAFTLYLLTFLIVFWKIIKWRENRLQREKKLLEEKIAIRTHQLTEEKGKVESTLQELKSTQTQLIQSEKMASLGEMTAGIAHEIQNPLNFVNNFSEVNVELIEEAGQEIENRNIDELTAILNAIKENEQKINHHGKRADAIVKGMLQHSRNSAGHNEPTDINALTDEYLRLAYQGFRAKDPRDSADKMINVILKTEFDGSIGKINIIPQDIGRVLLNLYNNAFYAVNEKKKMLEDKYEPVVTVSTKKKGGSVEISIRDNGSGIPPKVVDKIFQPFFTTKPTGQGTGLGLSLSYDIIKAHGGEIKVETKDGEGTLFIITLAV